MTRPRPRLLSFVFAVLLATPVLALGSACQLALHAADEEAQCSVPDGTRCPGTDLTCQGGRCRPCVPHDEICNGIDDNCDGQVDEGFDRDGDGYTVCQGDCNDDPDLGGESVHPGATELCNGVNDDCDDKTDEGTCPGGECWPSKPGCATSGDCCTVKDDCRIHGCTSLGCNPATGKCDATDCTTAGCPPTMDCDPTLRACVRKVAVGDPCGAVTDVCKEGTCIDPAMFGVARRVCATPCCTAEDCPAGLVCKTSTDPAKPGSVTGGAVCIRASELGLTLGTTAGNGTCSTGSQCRSGVCGPGGRCDDGCCGAVPCGAGGTCAYASSKVACGSPVGTLETGDDCGWPRSASWCKTGICVGCGFACARCSKRCCSSADCASDQRCGLAKPTSSVEYYAPFCFFASGLGGKKAGAPCLGGGDCRSGTCSDGRCSDYCCHDSDCEAPTICKPSASGPLRCLPK